MKTKLKPWVFRLSVFVLRLLSKIYFRAYGTGHENYPDSGPFIIAINHNSLMDIPIMALAVDRPMHTMAKESLFSIPILSWWLRAVGFFPVQRGKRDRLAFDTARQILAEAVSWPLPLKELAEEPVVGVPKPILASCAWHRNSSVRSSQWG